MLSGEREGVSEDVGNTAEGEEVEKEIEESKTNAPEKELSKASNGDKAKATVAAEVADSAEKLDRGVQA